MIDKTNPKLQLKKATGWFPAGDGFLKAMIVLPDGPFKLFVFFCLNADRRTATYQSSYRRLAPGIGKSRAPIRAENKEPATRLSQDATLPAAHLGVAGTFRHSAMNP